MKYLEPKFSSRSSSKAYRDNFDVAFGRKCPEVHEDLGPCEAPMPHEHCVTCRRIGCTEHGR